MKYKLFLFVSFAVGLLTGCTEFPSRFDRVDSDEIRVLDFVYEPAEASPGDTVQVKAFFSGKKFTDADIDWKISHNVIINKYGIDSAFDIKSLSPVPVQTYCSDNTICYSFSFVVPPDIFKTNNSIPDNWTSLLPESIVKTLPENIKNISKDSLINLLDLLTSSELVYNIAVDNLGISREQLSLVLPLVSQFFTVRMRIFADLKNEYTVESNYSVRYNTRFSKIPQIPVYVNKNPVIDSLGIYKVPGDRDFYYPSEKVHQFMRIDQNSASDNIVTIEDGYSYFLVAFHDYPDTTKTLDDLFDGGYHLEQIRTYWFFRQNDNETRDIPANQFMETDGVSTVNYSDFPFITPYDLQTVTKIYPPENSSIRKIAIWCQVQDDSNNEILRPVGSALKEGGFTFNYK